MKARVMARRGSASAAGRSALSSSVARDEAVAAGALHLRCRARWRRPSTSGRRARDRAVLPFDLRRAHESRASAELAGVFALERLSLGASGLLGRGDRELDGEAARRARGLGGVGSAARGGAARGRAALGAGGCWRRSGRSPSGALGGAALAGAGRAAAGGCDGVAVVLGPVVRDGWRRAAAARPGPGVVPFEGPGRRPPERGRAGAGRHDRRLPAAAACSGPTIAAVGRTVTVRTRRGSPRLATALFGAEAVGPGLGGTIAGAEGTGCAPFGRLGARAACCTSTGCSSRLTTRVCLSGPLRS